MPLKLISTDTQQEVHIGDTVVSFRGELATVQSIIPPHKEGSTGRVQTELGLHFPGVYNLKWIEE